MAVGSRSQLATLVCGLSVLAASALRAQSVEETRPALIHLDVAIEAGDRDGGTDDVATATADIAVIGFDRADAADLTLTFLERPPRRVVRLVTGDGDAIELDHRHAPLVRADVPLPTPASDGRARVTLRFEVEAAWRPDGSSRTLEIPMPVPEWPPRNAGEDAFRVTIALDTPGDRVSAFPTSIAPVGPIAAVGPSAFAADLPVPPAFVSLTVAAPGEAGWPAERIVDLIAIGVLLVLLAGATIRLWRTFR